MNELKQTIRYAKAPDGRAIAWSTMGSGPPVVVFSVGGHLEAELRCPPYARLYGELARKCTLVRYDGRGSGLSDREFQDITLNGLLEDAMAVVDAAQLERFSIFATILGAQSAIEYAARYPGRVDRLVIYGGMARGLMHRHPTAEQIALHEAIISALEAGWDDDAFRTLNARQANPGASQQELEDFATLHHAFCSARQYIGSWRWQATTDVSESAARVTCPSLVLHPRRDARIPFDEGRRLASLMPHAQFMPVESRNAMIMPSEPIYAEVMSEILAFLSQGQDSRAKPLGLDHLTPREHQVLELIAQGKDNLQIAAHLDMSEKTVRNHITPIFDKLQVENRAQAIVKAREAGMGKAGSTPKP